jgi:hypothetical protein
MNTNRQVERHAIQIVILTMATTRTRYRTPAMPTVENFTANSTSKKAAFVTASVQQTGVLKK